MKRTISNRDDVIDSRDVIERIKELTEEKEALEEALEEAQEAETKLEEAKEELKCWEEDYGEELKALESLQEQAEGYSDWEYGETLIRDSYFEEYAQELAEDIGAIDPDAKWPLNHIDWEAAAGELQMDYASVDFDGVEYWIRCC
mgnify:CR=1 FL=1